MSEWKALINPKSPVWSGVERYADSRIAELAMVCRDLKASEADIRAAQAGIAELERLKAVPDQLAASAAQKTAPTTRRGY